MARNATGSWTRHGHAKPQSPTYRIWHGIKSRCLDVNYHHYSNYGGRGITVCERWLKFENFLADMGERPGPAFSVDRVDNNGNYEPGNCRWATRSQQRNNSSQPVTWVEYQGQRRPLAEWAELLGMDRKWLYSRIVSYGWSPERAFTEPKRPPYPGTLAKLEAGK